MPKDFLTVTTRRTVATSATTRKSLRALIAAALSLALLLTGCTKTDDPEEKPPTPPVTANPSPTKTTDPTSTPTPEPTPTAPDPSQVINENTAEGAESVVPYVFELYQFTHDARDDALWSKFSSPECAFCADVSKGIANLVEADYFIQGGAISLERAEAVEEEASGLWMASFVITQGELSVVSNDNTVVSVEPAEEQEGQLVLEFVGEQWSIIGFR